ncbi:MAG TPA: ferredoxin family protein [Dehalococcoidia bacterium]|nr:ferredoxin family protein [Dehalococcoidia bacterium]
MTHFATSLCIDEVSHMCVDICPEACIHAEESVDRIAFIDAAACTDCGLCVPACPNSAIFAEADLPADEVEFAKITTLYFTDRDAARAMIP